MSISGISAASSAAYIQQVANAAKLGTGAQTTVEQAAAAPLGSIAPTQPTSAQPSGEVHHHHHHGGGAAPESANLTQSGTANSSGTNILNTLV